MKAMNCPGHMLVFAEARSAAIATCRSGATSRRRCTVTKRRACSSGLTRVRQFSQDDAHCFVMEEQIGDEVETLLRLVQRVYGDFDFEPTRPSCRPGRRSSSVEVAPGTTRRQS